MTISYPATLPQYFQENGYGEALPELNIESPTDSGKPKVRGRFTSGYRPIQGVLWCSPAQVEAFEFFYFETTERGTLPFLWVNPRTQGAALMRFRAPAPRYGSLGGGGAIPISLNLYQQIKYAAARFDVTTITFDSTAYTFDSANQYF